MRSNSTILKQSKPALRSRIILRQSIEVQPGLVIPALPNLPEHTSVELQILTPISQEAEDLLTYLSLTVAP